MQEEENEFVDRIALQYANIMADVIIHKNLVDHLKTVWQHILDISKKADEDYLKGMSSTGIKALGFELYRVKDMIMDELEKGSNP